MTLVDRYGRAIEADFHAQFGVDLLDFFTGRLRWGKFWRLLSQLGGDSRYMKAQLDDPEVAEMLAAEAVAEEIEREKKGLAPREWHPASTDWTLLHEILAGIWDRQGAIISVLAELPTGVKTRRPPPPAHARPLTEMEKARKRLRAEYDAAEDERIMSEVERAKGRWRAMQQAQAQE